MRTATPFRENNFRGHAAMLATSIIFGLNIPITKYVLSQGDFSSFALMFYRMAGGALLFWTISLFTRREHVPPRDILKICAASMFALVINQGAFLIGLSMTSPVDTSVIATLVPILTMLLAALFLREPITLKKTAGVLLGAGGALMIILQGADVRSGSSLAGNLMCLMSCVGFSIYLSAFRSLISRYSPITLMKWMFLFATVVCGPFCYGEISAVDYASVAVGSWLGTAFIIFFSTFTAYLLLPIGQKALRPTLVGMYNYMQPLVASFVAIAAGMDVFGWRKATAALLVFCGVWLVIRSKSRAQMEAQPEN